jgi:hypothetical protein
VPVAGCLGRAGGSSASCAPAIPGRYLPLRITGLRIAGSRLAIDVHDDGWHLTGLDDTGIKLIRQPRHRNPSARALPLPGCLR